MYMYYSMIMSASIFFLQIDEPAFYETIDCINAIFMEAEALNCHTYTEGCIACMTGYIIHFCFKTHYERVSSMLYVC